MQQKYETGHVGMTLECSINYIFIPCLPHKGKVEKAGVSPQVLLTGVRNPENKLNLDDGHSDIQIAP